MWKCRNVETVPLASHLSMTKTKLFSKIVNAALAAQSKWQLATSYGKWEKQRVSGIATYRWYKKKNKTQNEKKQLTLENW